MSLFNDDPFEDIVRNFFGQGRPSSGRGREVIIRGEEEDRNIDFIETEGSIFIIFELPGFSEKDVDVIVKGNSLEITVRKVGGEKIQDYLVKKLSEGMSIRRELPSFINPKGFRTTMRNGVLEIEFGKR